VHMTVTAARACASIACLIALLAACSGGSDHSGSGVVDAGPTPLPDIKCPDDIPAFTATPQSGLEAKVTHETLRVRLTSAAPVHPTKNAVNNWTVQFMDRDGAVLGDVEIAAACAHMPPPHNHGTAPLKGTKPLSDPGQFELDYLNFIMRGPWQLQLAINRTGAKAGNADDSDGGAEVAPTEYTDCDTQKKHPGSEKAVFYFCVAD
jgi:hypothetical protein